MNMETETTTKVAFAEGLRELAALIDKHPELTPKYETRITVWAHTPEKLKELLPALIDGSGIANPVTKKESGSVKQFFDFHRRFSGDIIFEVTTEKKNAGCQKVTIMVPVEEWQCGPVLEGLGIQEAKTE